MATKIQIKRTNTHSLPGGGIDSGELVYVYAGTGTANGNENRLFLGGYAGTSSTPVIVGGEYFTNLLDHNPGVVTASSALIVDSDKKLDELSVDNLKLNGRILSSTDTNGDIQITPDGTGKTVIGNLHVKVGGVDTTLLEFIQDSSGGTLAGDGTTDVTYNDTSGTTTINVKAGGVGTTQLADDAVTSAKLGPEAVDTNALKDGNVTTGKIADDAVTSAKLGSGAVDTDALGTNAVISAKIATGAVTADEIASDAVTTAKILNANVNSDKLADNAVATAKIANDAVTTLKILNANITTAKIADDAVTVDKIGPGAVDSTALGADSVTAAKIATGAVGSTEIAASAVDEGKIVNGAVTEDKLAANAVTTGKIAAGAVGESDLATGAVTNGKIGALAVNAAKLASDAVSTAKIVNDAVTTAKILDSNVTTPKLVDDAVTSAKIAAGAVDTDALGANAVTSAKLQTGAINTSQLASTAVTAAKIAANAITTEKINANAVTNAKLANSTITLGTSTLTLGAATTDIVGLTSLAVDSVSVNGTEIITNTNVALDLKTRASSNTNINLSPDGTGAVQVPSGYQSRSGFNDNSLTNKQYVDNFVSGLAVKDSVKVATTQNLAATYDNGTSGDGATLTASGNGVLAIDGQNPSVGDRVLVKNQTTANQNGIYVVTNAGASGSQFLLTRASDANAGSELSGGSFVFVELGTANSDSGFVTTHNGNPTMGGTSPGNGDITFTQFSGAGLIIAGSGIDKTGNTLSVKLESGSTATLEISSDQIRVKDGSITNDKIFAAAAGAGITQDKLAMNAATVRSSAAGIAQANLGLASFDASTFAATAGFITVSTIDGGTYTS